MIIAVMNAGISILGWNSLYLEEEFGDMAYWPNDGGRFNAMHLTDGSSMQVMEESLQADLSQPDFTRQHPQCQGFSYTGTGVGPVPVLAGNYRALLFSWKQRKEQSDSKGYSRRSKQKRQRSYILSWTGTNICKYHGRHGKFSKSERISVRKD